jgi:hypothetical protein
LTTTRIPFKAKKKELTIEQQIAKDANELSKTSNIDYHQLTAALTVGYAIDRKPEQFDPHKPNFTIAKNGETFKLRVLVGTRGTDVSVDPMTKAAMELNGVNAIVWVWRYNNAGRYSFEPRGWVELCELAFESDVWSLPHRALTPLRELEAPKTTT